MPATLNVVTNDLPAGKRTFKISKADYDPAAPAATKINVNFLRITKVGGGAVAAPTSAADFKFGHSEAVIHVMNYKFTDSTKSTLIVWFYAEAKSTGPSVKMANLVVTINSTSDEGTDPGVAPEAS